MWLLCNNIMVLRQTSSVTQRCGMMDDPSFPLCHSHAETLIHLLRGMGSVCVGLGCKLLSSRVLLVELFGVSSMPSSKSLLIARGFSKLLIECDSSVAVSFVTKGCPSSHPCSTICFQNIPISSQRLDNLPFTISLRRTTGLPTDYLANLVQVSSLDISFFVSPTRVQVFLFCDRTILLVFASLKGS